MIEERGSTCYVALPEFSFLSSGAVFAYRHDDLEKDLDRYSEILIENGWPVRPLEFVKRVAAEWVESGNPVVLAIKEAFGGQ